MTHGIKYSMRVKNLFYMSGNQELYRIYRNKILSISHTYRPISLLSNFIHVFEKIMFIRLKAFIDKNYILYRSQYGFCDNHSTQHAILGIVNSIQRNVDNNLLSHGIFIDLKKSFDTVDHTILLSKLNHYGVRGIVNDCFHHTCTYFKVPKKQKLARLCLRRKLCHVVFHKDQCCVLILFLIFINDIPNFSQKFKFLLFAYDTNMLYADKHPKFPVETVNSELKSVCEWLRVNKLTLNTKKSN